MAACDIKHLKAPISEIFASYQGEGIYAGEPQVFIRFSGCNLRCGYCDTAESQTLSEHQKYYSIGRILEVVRESTSRGLAGDSGSVPRTVSLTGGEPLLYSDFLSHLLPELKKLKVKIYLETNGTLPSGLRRHRKWIDVVAMDIKLASGCNESSWEQHKEFLKIAGGKAFVKLVLTDRTTDAEVQKAVTTVRAVSADIPFVFQPATLADNFKSVEPYKIFEWSRSARKKLKQVHVQPQMHKIWRVR